MSEENLNSSSPSQEGTLPDKESKKRISYVSKSLKSMIEFVGKVYSQLGHTAFHSNKAIATVHGFAPESIKMHLSSAQQYNILELKHGIGYKITEHFQKLYLPKSDNDKRSAVIESLKHPETYQQLFKDYEYHVVPFDGVKNHFIRSYGFNNDVATKAAQIFVDNLKDYELLDTRGVLTSAMAYKPITPEVKVDPEEINEDSNSNPENNSSSQNQLPATIKKDKIIFQSELDATGKKTVPIYLIEGKTALFVYPEDITEDDIELVKHQVEGILLRIKLEAKSRQAQKTKEAQASS